MASPRWAGGGVLCGDFCSGKVFGPRYVDGEMMERRQLADTGLSIRSFAQDNNGELYLFSPKSGIYRLADQPGIGIQ